MPEDTNNHNLNRPDKGQKNWGDDLNQNFSDLDTALKNISQDGETFSPEWQSVTKRLTLPDLSDDPTEWLADQTPIGLYSDPDGLATGNIKNSGNPDIVAADNGMQNVYWFENRGHGRPENFQRHHIANGFTEIEGLAAGDLRLGGDGRENNIVICDQGAGELIVASPDAGQQPWGSWTTAVLDSSAPNIQTAMIADVDGDGETDIIYAYEGSGSGSGGGLLVGKWRRDGH